MKLRLLLFPECNRNCIGCCNKQWDLNSIPQCKSFEGYDEIILTGGEPMLQPELVKEVIREIWRKLNGVYEFDDQGRWHQIVTRIYMYTAKIDDLPAVLGVMNYLSGITVTLHDQNDVIHFKRLVGVIKDVHQQTIGQTNRLNVFRGVDISGIDLDNWIVKDDIIWIDPCPLPSDEAFMRLN